MQHNYVLSCRSGNIAVCIAAIAAVEDSIPNSGKAPFLAYFVSQSMNCWKRRRSNNDLYSNLKSFVCEEEIQRYKGNLKGSKTHQFIDHVSAKLSFRRRGTLQQSVRQNTRMRPSLSDLPGAWSTGNLGLCCNRRKDCSKPKASHLLLLPLWLVNPVQFTASWFQIGVSLGPGSWLAALPNSFRHASLDLDTIRRNSENSKEVHLHTLRNAHFRNRLGRYSGYGEPQRSDSAFANPGWILGLVSRIETARVERNELLWLPSLRIGIGPAFRC